jgi:hypothetical protein
MDLNAALLDTSAGLRISEGDLNACLASHDLYNPFQFVLRLSPEVHRKLEKLPNGANTLVGPGWCLQSMGGSLGAYKNSNAEPRPVINLESCG